MKVATWNVQHLFPTAKFEKRWQFLEDAIQPDIAILTEAKFPENKTPEGWSAQFDPEGLGGRRKWGTILVSKGLETAKIVDTPRRFRGRKKLDFTWHGAIQAAEIIIEGHVWGAIVGLYAPLEDAQGKKQGNGAASTDQMLREIAPIVDRYPKLIVGGDLNTLPSDKSPLLESLELVDVVEHTSSLRPRLPGCRGCSDENRCGHLWTHRNKSAKSVPQNIDYIFISKKLLPAVISVSGGAGDFPDVWEYSDHAPVVLEIDTG